MIKVVAWNVEHFYLVCLERAAPSADQDHPPVDSTAIQGGTLTRNTVSTILRVRRLFYITT